MRSRAIIIAIVLATGVSASSVSLGAWGFEAHHYITSRAIDLLPAEIRPYFSKHRTFIVEHSIDPDLWRNAGFEEEPPRHFVDLDAYGPPPFSALPRDFDAAVVRHGRGFVLKNGTLPWRAQEFYNKLVKAFEDSKAGRPYALENARFYVAVLAHYAADANVPFHAVLNYDGQLTNQHGIHSRFESELFQRTSSRFTVNPAPVSPLSASARDYMFETLAASFALVPGILAADKAAIGSGTEYGEAYFAAFEARALPSLEERLASSITTIASLVTQAWIDAGRPDLPLEPKRTARKRRVTP